MNNKPEKNFLQSLTESNTLFRDSGEKDSLIAEIANDYLDRLDRGESPSIEEYADQFPENAEFIRRTLKSLKALNEMALDESDCDDAIAKFDSTGGRLLGDYQLVRELGRGGMGIVYEAEQISLKRRVALKILPFASTLSDQALRRFRNEILAAAQLDHPNIVNIFGAGTDRGIHFYAMRLVKGSTLTSVIAELSRRHATRNEMPSSFDSQSLFDTEPNPTVAPDSQGSGDDDHDHVNRNSRLDASTRPNAQSLTIGSVKNSPSLSHYRSVARLFCLVADGLEHAHQQGIVHRDIKPSNILVDEAGKPWITDFGLARIDSNTVLTVSGDILGTAKYMSPEQASGKRRVIDHRSDIYSLAATLYEVVTFQPPHIANEREELFRKILFSSPDKPRHLMPSIPVDLETIILRSLEKDPSDRYESAAAMASDLRSFADGLTIASRRPSYYQQVKRSIRRRPALAINVAATLFIALTALLVTLLVQQHERKKAETALISADRANRQLVERNQELEEAREDTQQAQMAAIRQKEVANATNRFLVDEILWSMLPIDQNERSYTLREVADHAVEWMNDSPPENPLVLAAFHQIIGDIYVQLGENKKAEHHLKASLSITRNDPLADYDLVLESIDSLSNALFLQGKYDEAKLLLAELIEETPSHDLSVFAHTRLATMNHQAGESQKIQEMFFQLLNSCESKYGKDSHVVAGLLEQIGSHFLAIGDADQAIRYLTRSKQLLQGIDDPNRSEMRNLDTLLGKALTIAKRTDEAIPLLESALEQSKRAAGETHVATHAIRIELCFALMNAGRLDEAYDMAMFVIDEQQNWDSDYRHSIDNALTSLGLILIEQGDPDRAELMFRKSLALPQAIGPGADANEVVGRINLAIALRDQGKYQESIQLLAEATELGEKTLGVDNEWTCRARSNLGQNFWLAKDYAKASEVYQRHVDILKKHRDPDDPELAEMELNLAINLQDSNQSEKAIGILRDLLRPNVPLDRNCRLEVSRRIREYHYSHQNVMESYRADLVYHSIFLEQQIEMNGEASPQSIHAAVQLAITFQRLNMHEDIVKLLREWIPRARETLSVTDDDLYLGMSVYGNALAQIQEFDEAILTLRTQYEASKGELGEPHMKTALSKLNLARCLKQTKHEEDALQLLNELCSQKNDLPLRQQRNAYQELIALYSARGERLLAADAAERGLAMINELASADRLQRANELDEFCYALIDAGLYHASIPVLRDSLNIRAEIAPNDWAHFDAMSMYGMAIATEGRIPEAVEWIRRGYLGLIDQQSSIPAHKMHRLAEVRRVYTGVLGLKSMNLALDCVIPWGKPLSQQ